MSIFIDGILFSGNVGTLHQEIATSTPMPRGNLLASTRDLISTPAPKAEKVRLSIR
jgi:hypothetical protein